MSKQAQHFPTFTPTSLCALRDIAGLNQEDFWAPIGVGQSAGSRYENGQELPEPVALLVHLKYVAGIELAFPPVVQWNSAPPTEEGHYWMRTLTADFKHVASGPEMIETYTVFGRDELIVRGRHFHLPAKSFTRHTQFAGPIPAAKDPITSKVCVWERDDEATCALLDLVDVEVTPEDLAEWSDDQCKTAEEWAGATHLRASDNDIPVPPMPRWVKPFARRTVTA